MGADLNDQLSHLDADGKVRMVDVSDKPITTRRAVAEGHVRISSELSAMIKEKSLRKGDLLAAVRIAGIQAAKRTAELIPLCHNIVLSQVDVEARVEANEVILQATVVADGKTGVEMEALTAVTVAALTVVDMGKSVDRSMVIGPIRLLSKTGGTHGAYAAPARARIDGHAAAHHGGRLNLQRSMLARIGDRRIGARAGGDASEATFGGDSGNRLRNRRRRIDRTATANMGNGSPKAGSDSDHRRHRSFPRDVTPEATIAVLERRHPGLLELARLRLFPENSQGVSVPRRGWHARTQSDRQSSWLTAQSPGVPRSTAGRSAPRH